MNDLDDIHPEEIVHKELRWRVLALALIFILAVGMALMLYPAVFATPTRGTIHAVLFGFCALSGLLMIDYLVDRHILICRLRGRLAARDNAIQRVKQHASSKFLASLPALDDFTNRLSLRFRRVSGVDQPLSVLAIKIELRPDVCNLTEAPVVYADAGLAVLRRMRGEDSLYLIEPGAYGILLPRISTHAAEVIKSRLEEQLRDAAGLVPRFNFSVRLINYPDQAKSADDMLKAIRPCLGSRPN